MRRLSKRVFVQILQKRSDVMLLTTSKAVQSENAEIPTTVVWGRTFQWDTKTILKFHPKTNYYRQYLHTVRGDVRLSYIVIVLPCKYIGLRHSHVTGSSLASGFSRAFPTPPDVSHDSLCIHLISAYNWALPDPTPCFLWKRNMDSGVPQITVQDTYGQWNPFFALWPIRESTPGAGYIGVIFTAMYASPFLNTISLTKLIGRVLQDYMDSQPCRYCARSGKIYSQLIVNLDIFLLRSLYKRWIRY